MIYIPCLSFLWTNTHSDFSFVLFLIALWKCRKCGWCGCLKVKANSRCWIDNLWTSIKSFYSEKSSKDTKHSMYRFAQRKCKCPCGLSISRPSGKSPGQQHSEHIIRFLMPEYCYGFCEMCRECHQRRF